MKKSTLFLKASLSPNMFHICARWPSYAVSMCSPVSSAAVEADSVLHWLQPHLLHCPGHWWSASSWISFWLSVHITPCQWSDNKIHTTINIFLIYKFEINVWRSDVNLQMMCCILVRKIDMDGTEWRKEMIISASSFCCSFTAASSANVSVIIINSLQSRLLWCWINKYKKHYSSFPSLKRNRVAVILQGIESKWTYIYWIPISCIYLSAEQETNA